MKWMIALLLFCATLCQAQVGVMDIPYQPVATAGGVPPANVLWSKFNGNVTDSSGNGLNGTAIGSPTYAKGEDGVAGHAILFDGSTQSVTNAGTGAMGTFTICVWISPNTLGSAYQAICYGNNATTGLILHTSMLDFYNGGDHATGTLTGSPDWTHVAVVCNAHTCQLYINGVASGSTFTITSDINFNAIAQEGDGSALFNGYMDDLRIWSTARSSADIAAIAAAPAAEYRTWRFAEWHPPILTGAQ